MGSQESRSFLILSLSLWFETEKEKEKERGTRRKKKEKKGILIESVTELKMSKRIRLIMAVQWILPLEVVNAVRKACDVVGNKYIRHSFLT